jgi:hypothetical protein
MVNISITQSWIAANPQFSANTFSLNIGEPGYIYLSISNAIRPEDRTSPGVNGGPSQVLLRMNESFDIGNEEFEMIVYSAKNGGKSNFLNRILYLVNNGIIQVQQDGGTPLSAKQVYSYSAP